MKKNFHPLINFEEISNKDLIVTNCPICNSSHNRVVKKINGWNIVKCKNCGFKFSNARVREEIINDYYKKRPNNYNSNSTPGSWLIENKKHFFTALINKMSKKFNKDNKLTSFIEIGSGDGSFIKLLGKETRWRIKGYEPCLSIKLNNILSEDFMKSNIKKESVDIVFSASVLEHIYHPIKIFIKIHKILKKNGLFLSTGIPNYKSLANYTGVKNFHSDCPPTHVNYFDQRSLKLALEKSGFSKIKISTYGLTNKLRKNSTERKKTFLNCLSKLYLKNVFLIPHFSYGDKLLLISEK